MKNKMQITTSIFLILSMLLSSAASFAPQEAPAPVTVTGVTIDCGEKGVRELGDSFYPNVIVNYSNGSTGSTTWSASGPGITPDGTLTDIGVATYTAGIEGQSASCSIEYINTLKNVLIKKDGNVLDTPAIAMETGNVKYLNEFFEIVPVGQYPENNVHVTNPNFDLSVFTDRENNVVSNVVSYNADTKQFTANEKGSAQLRIRQAGYPDDDKDRWVTVTVTDAIIPVSGIGFSAQTNVINHGESFTFAALVSPEEATDKTVRFTSDNPAVVSIDETSGVATANGIGYANIVAASGNYSAMVGVSVPQVTLDPGTGFSSETLSGFVGETLELKLVYGTEADRTRAYQTATSGTEFATVSVIDSETIHITGIVPGTTTIFITVPEASFTDSCAVTFTEAPTPEPTEEPVTESTEEPVTESTEETVTESTEEPVTESTEEPVTEPTEEPVTESTEEPATESTEEPVTESTENSQLSNKDVPIPLTSVSFDPDSVNLGLKKSATVKISDIKPENYVDVLRWQVKGDSQIFASGEEIKINDDFKITANESDKTVKIDSLSDTLFADQELYVISESSGNKVGTLTFNIWDVPFTSLSFNPVSTSTNPIKIPYSGSEKAELVTEPGIGQSNDTLVWKIGTDLKTPDAAGVIDGGWFTYNTLNGNLTRKGTGTAASAEIQVFSQMSPSVQASLFVEPDLVTAMDFIPNSVSIYTNSEEKTVLSVTPAGYLEPLVWSIDGIKQTEGETVFSTNDVKIDVSELSNIVISGIPTSTITTNKTIKLMASYDKYSANSASCTITLLPGIPATRIEASPDYISCETGVITYVPVTVSPDNTTATLTIEVFDKSGNTTNGVRTNLDPVSRKLEITGVLPGSYTVRISSKADGVSKDINVIVADSGGVPVTPAVVGGQAARLGYRFNRITWNVSLDSDGNPDEMVKYYKVVRTTNGGTTETQVGTVPQEAVTSAVRSLSLKDENPDSNLLNTHKYLVKACTSNNICSTGTFIDVFDTGGAAATFSATTNLADVVQLTLPRVFSSTVNAIAVYRKTLDNSLKSAVTILTSLPDDGTFLDGTVQNGVRYQYTIRLCQYANDPNSDALCGIESDPKIGVALGQSGNIPAPLLTVSRPAYNTLLVTPAMPENTKYPATAYFYEWASDSTFTTNYGNEYIDTPSAYRINGLNEDTDYWIRVHAIANDNGIKMSSNAATKQVRTALIPAPTITAVTNTESGSAALAWKVPALGSLPGYSAAFKVEYRPNANAAYTVYQPDSPSTFIGTNGVIPGLNNNNTYEFRMNICFYKAGFDRICGKTYSNVVSSFIGFKAPYLRTAVGTPFSAYLNWDQYNALGTDFGRYLVQYKLTSDTDWSDYLYSEDMLTPAQHTITVSPLVQNATYNFRVFVVRRNGTRSLPSNVMTLTIPGFATPTNLSVATGVNSVRLTWRGVTGADQYEIEYKRSTETQWIKGGTANDNSILIEKLESGVTYNFRIRGLKQIYTRLDMKDYRKRVVYSAYTAAVNSTPNIYPPTDLRVLSTGFNTINLSWTGSVNGVTYRVFQSPTDNGTAYDVVWEGIGTSVQISGLKNSTRYSFRVAAVPDGGGQSTAFSNTVSATTTRLDPPKNVRGTPVNRGVRLTWTNVPGISTYRILYSTNNANLKSCSPRASLCDGFPVIDINTRNYYPGYQYPVTGLINDTRYYFRVYTNNNGEYSTNYSAVSVTPAFAAIQGLRAYGGPYSVVLSWKPVAGLRAVESYSVKWATDSKITNFNAAFYNESDICQNEECQVEIGVCDDGRSFTMENNRRYYFTVQAFDDSGEESYVSRPVNARLQRLKAPTRVRATPSNQMVTITFTGINTLPIDSVYYEVYGKRSDDRTQDFDPVYCDNNIFNPERPTYDPVTDTGTCVVTRVNGEDITNYSRYSFNVRSIVDTSTMGCILEDASSNASSTVSVTPKLTKVSKLTRASNVWHAIQLSWANLGYTSYKVEVSLTNNKRSPDYFSNGWEAIITTNGLTIFTPDANGISGWTPTEWYEGFSLREGSRYYFRVTPIDGYGEEVLEARSNVYGVTLNAMPAPSSLKATKTYGMNGVKLTWAPRKGVSHYKVMRSFTGRDGTWTEVALKKSTENLVYEETGLPVRQTVYYRVYSGISYSDVDPDPTAWSTKPSNTVSVRYNN